MRELASLRQPPKGRALIRGGVAGLWQGWRGWVGARCGWYEPFIICHVAGGPRRRSGWQLIVMDFASVKPALPPRRALEDSLLHVVHALGRHGPGPRRATPRRIRQRSAEARKFRSSFVRATERRAGRRVRVAADDDQSSVPLTSQRGCGRLQSDGSIAGDQPRTPTHRTSRYPEPPNAPPSTPSQETDE